MKEKRKEDKEYKEKGVWREVKMFKLALNGWF